MKKHRKKHTWLVGCLAGGLLLTSCRAAANQPTAQQQTSKSAALAPGDAAPEERSDFELIYGHSADWADRTTRSQSPADASGRYPEGIYLSLSDVEWPDIIRRNWQDTPSGKQYRAPDDPVELSVELSPDGAWIRRVEMRFDLPPDRWLSAGPDDTGNQRQAVCQAVSDTLFKIHGAILDQITRLNASDPSAGWGTTGSAVCMLMNSRSQCRNIRFQFETGDRYRSWQFSFDGAPLLTEPPDDAAPARLMEPDPNISPAIGICSIHDWVSTGFIQRMTGVLDACRRRQLNWHFEVYQQSFDKSGLIAAIRACRDRGCRSVIVDAPPDSSLSELIAAAGSMKLICLEPIDGDPDGRQSAVVTTDPEAGTRALAEAALQYAKSASDARQLKILGPFPRQDELIENLDNQRLDGLNRCFAASDVPVEWHYAAPNQTSAQWEGRSGYQSALIRGEAFDLLIDYPFGSIQDLLAVMRSLGMDPAARPVYQYGLFPEYVAALQDRQYAGIVYEDLINVGRLAVETAAAMADGQAVRPVQQVPDRLLTADNLSNILEPRPTFIRPQPAGDAAAVSASETAGTDDQPADGTATTIVMAYDGWTAKPPDLTAFNQLLQAKGHPYALQLVNIHRDVHAGFMNWWADYTHPDAGDETWRKINRDSKASFLRDYPTGIEWHPGRSYTEVLERYREAGETIDLICKADAAGLDDLPADVWIQQGLLADLAPYLDTETGRQIREAYPDPLWQTLSRPAGSYLLPGKLNPKPQTAVCWVNKRLADRYQIDISNWSTDIWAHRDELTAVWNGEKDDPKFMLLNAAPFNFPQFPTQTPVYDAVYPVFPMTFDPASGRYQCLYDDTTYTQTLDFVQSLVDQKYFTYVTTSDPETFFITWQPPFDHPEDYVPIGEGAVRFAQPFQTVMGVTAWSEHPEAAVELLGAIYTDPELNRAPAGRDAGGRRDLRGDQSGRNPDKPARQRADRHSYRVADRPRGAGRGGTGPYFG